MIHVGFKPVCLCLLCFFTIIKAGSDSAPPQLDKYRTFDEINEFLTNILLDYENVTSEVVIGKSFEGREIRGIRISFNNETENSTKLAILVDGGIHAREWVSTVSVLYTIYHLLENSSYSDLMENADWYLFPLLNPDGYIYSMDPNGDRQWRKNRSVNPISECRGVDLNRNFDFAWGGDGSSGDPCDWGYRGTHPFSEPESKALADFITSKMPQIKMYLTLHSAAQAIIYPWGFTNERPPDWQELDKLAREATEEMFKINQTSYLVGPTTETVGVGAGGSDDWAKAVAGIKYVYTMELPGLDYPQGGFHPPETALDIISQETFEGIKVFASYLIKSTINNKPAEVNQAIKERPLKAEGVRDGLQRPGTNFLHVLSPPAPQWYNPFPFGYTFI